jgi:hypothetical protein
MKIMFGLILAFMLFSCDESKDQETIEVPDEKLSMEDLIHRKVTADLSIPGNENYLMDVYKAHLNTDDFEDAIILVNRKEFVLESMKNSPNADAQKELGYFGNYNHMYFYDGLSHTVTRRITIPSSALIPLKINFLNIQSEAFKDFTLDVRIRESIYRNFYTVRNGAPMLVFQWNIADINENGELNTNHIKYDKGSYSLAKDILIYKGEVLNELPKDLLTDYELKTKPSGELLYRFFYNPKEGAYFTKKD